MSMLLGICSQCRVLSYCKCKGRGGPARVSGTTSRLKKLGQLE